jgi:predicted N-acetyltransferase YhbS
MLDEDSTLGALRENLHVTHDRKREGIGARLMAESATPIEGGGTAFVFTYAWSATNLARLE